MEKDGPQRRAFLRTSGIAVTALAAGGSMIFEPDNAWAMATSSLDEHSARTCTGRAPRCASKNIRDRDAAGLRPHRPRHQPGPRRLGRDYTRILGMYDRFAGMWLVGEDLPQQANGVTLHPTEKDQHGLPVPVVHFTNHANDFAMHNHRPRAIRVA